MMLALCIIALGVMFQSPQAMATTSEVDAEAYNIGNLLTVISQARDGDVIGIMNAITTNADVVIGDPNKHITLKRMNSESSFIINSTTTVQNITFEGDGVVASNPYVTALGEVIFQDVTFQNSKNESSHGGAASFNDGVVIVNNCIFKNNSAGEGGHIKIEEWVRVTIENTIFEDGYASYSGGAIKSSTNGQIPLVIRNSFIKNNSAGNYGGGISNNGYMQIYDTKIYDNSAVNGGADIANTVFGMFSMNNFENLSELYKDDDIIPIGWISDYAFQAGVNIPNVNPLDRNSLLKLAYEIPPTEVILEVESLGTASDSKVIGLESGKHYMITMGDIVSYSKADGTLTPNEPEAEVLLGTEIVGLTNGETYKVEEYTPTPVEEEPTPEEPIEELPIEEPEDEEPKEEEPKEEPEPQPEPEEPIDEEPTPEPPITEEPEEPIIKDPEPSNPPSSSNDRPRRNSSPVVKKEEPSPAVVLSNGKAILDTTKKEYLLGYTDGLLGSKGTVTKAELVQIVYRLLTPESKGSIYSEKNKYKDVESSDWYNEAVSTLTNAGLISVGADGKFNPDKNITWGEMLTIFSKFAKPNHEWKIITKHWARDSINTAISYRWFEYNDQFNPDGEVTRLEMLNFINTLFDWAAKQ